MLIVAPVVPLRLSPNLKLLITLTADIQEEDMEVIEEGEEVTTVVEEQEEEVIFSQVISRIVDEVKIQKTQQEEY